MGKESENIINKLNDLYESLKTSWNSNTVSEIHFLENRLENINRQKPKNKSKLIPVDYGYSFLKD